MAFLKKLTFCLLVLAVSIYFGQVWLIYNIIDPFMKLIGEDKRIMPEFDIQDENNWLSDDELKRYSPTLRKAIQAVLERRFDDAQALLEKCSDRTKIGLKNGGLPDEDETLYDPYCINKIGEYLFSGMVYTKNFRAAVEHFVEAANVGNEDAQYNLGILFANAIEKDPNFEILQEVVSNHNKLGFSSKQGSLQKRAGNKEALSVLYLYAASTAGHPGALMAMGYRHSEGFGVPKICSTSALNYIEVAKSITEIYSSGMPQAVELIRLNLDYKKNKKLMSDGEINLFTQIASSGDTAVAAAIGKRYLLGIDGFKQNYSKALEYLRMAAEANHGSSFGLLGYMYALGLGVEKNLDLAHQYFVQASIEGDALGQNGLGYIYFHGTAKQDRNAKMAFQHFNESSYGGSADGMFNLASIYLTGVGAEQSFQKAVLWYTQALDRGHTPAAYSLAIMHLNGVGTVRDCNVAVNLLKRVCERGSWVSSRLQEAYALQHLNTESSGVSQMVSGNSQYINHDMSAFLFLQLAEAGHEVSQMNLAHLLDTGKSSIMMSNPAYARFYAQRFYELSADQGSASSELRLGDFAYYGWGQAVESADAVVYDEDSISAEEVSEMKQLGIEVGDSAEKKEKAKKKKKEFNEEDLLKQEERAGDGNVAEEGAVAKASNTGSTDTAGEGSMTTGEVDAAGKSPEDGSVVTADPEVLSDMQIQEIVSSISQEADMETAISHYWKVSNMQVTGEWMQHFVAKASFNLGFMYQFGLGIPQDLGLAKRLYQRSLELDPTTVATPITIVLYLLWTHKWWLSLPTWKKFRVKLIEDPRTHIIILQFIFICVLLCLRPMIKRRWDDKVRLRDQARAKAKKEKEEEFAKYKKLMEEEEAKIKEYQEAILKDPRVQQYAAQNVAQKETGSHSASSNSPIEPTGSSSATRSATGVLPPTTTSGISVTTNGTSAFSQAPKKEEKDQAPEGGYKLGGSSDATLGKLVQSDQKES